MKRKIEIVNLDLKKEVLGIIDKLYKTFLFLNRESKYISIQILESISFSYANMNCDLCFTFDKTVIPYFKKMTENERLEGIKGLLTNGYVDINKNRIYMRHLPFLNRKSDEPNYSHETKIPGN